MAEELTDEERDNLRSGCHFGAEQKALRIIDAQAAALERVRACVRDSGDACHGPTILALASTGPETS